jgi:formate--tetrahydrofolate ligase
VVATKLGLRLSEYTVTEAGFGADLGAEKFIDIKCRQSGLQPDVVVLVATVRALKYHGGMELKDLGQTDMAALEKGVENLKKHIENIRRFGLPPVVAINSFITDTDEEVQLIQDKCDHLGAQIVPAAHWAHGGAGAEELARTVVQVVEGTKNDFTFLYDSGLKLWDKTRIIAQDYYGANDIMGDKRLRGKFARLQKAGYGDLPVCMAKTQYSFSTDPGLRGRPKNFDVPIRDVKLSAGAGFVVVVTGDVMTMPGLPKVPAAEVIDLDEEGRIVGLF